MSAEDLKVGDKVRVNSFRIAGKPMLAEVTAIDGDSVSVKQDETNVKAGGVSIIGFSCTSITVSRSHVEKA